MTSLSVHGGQLQLHQNNGDILRNSEGEPFTTRYAFNAKDLALREVASRAMTWKFSDVGSRCILQA